MFAMSQFEIAILGILGCLILGAVVVSEILGWFWAFGEVAGFIGGLIFNKPEAKDAAKGEVASVEVPKNTHPVFDLRSTDQGSQQIPK